jgi:7-carboxy-7-deazaguanine synthase
MTAALRVHSVFSSIQGESTAAGRPCTFVRLAGCPFACTYCDTLEARDGAGREMTVDDVVRQAIALKNRLVEVTGGEPLAQEATPALLAGLADAGLEVLLETSGAFPLVGIDGRVRVVMDVKTPGSGMSEHFLEDNLAQIGRRPMELKLVVTGKDDFRWGADFIARNGLEGLCELIFSPAAGLVPLADLAGWLLASGLEARLQPQLHKLIWPEGERER